MSITVRVGDPVLSRMLYLEAKQYGFEESRTSILIIDPVTEETPEPAPALLTIGITADPEAVPMTVKRRLLALLALPFSAKELENAVLHFREGSELRVERTGDILYLNGNRIALSHTEARLFDLLYDNRHRVVTEAELTALLGKSATHTNTLAVFLHRLRRKLGEAGVCIQTLRGKGCQWIERSQTV